jgi:hypothetical protein
MRIVLLAIALIVGSSLVIPADAATRSAIAIARGECAKLAAKQHFGKRYIQRRNFIPFGRRRIPHPTRHQCQESGSSRLLIAIGKTTAHLR